MQALIFDAVYAVSATVLIRPGRILAAAVSDYLCPQVTASRTGERTNR